LENTIFLTKFVQKLFSMHSEETFGALVRKLREESKMPLRKVAAFLDLDPSTLSKIERNDRSANREHIEKLSELFAIDRQALLIAYLSDKITFSLLREECSEAVIKAVEHKIKYYRTINVEQRVLDLK
jgi:transcriptional regulator with XRE-family HTH domain